MICSSASNAEFRRKLKSHSFMSTSSSESTNDEQDFYDALEEIPQDLTPQNNIFVSKKPTTNKTSSVKDRKKIENEDHSCNEHTTTQSCSSVTQNPVDNSSSSQTVSVESLLCKFTSEEMEKEYNRLYGGDLPENQNIPSYVEHPEYFVTVPSTATNYKPGVIYGKGWRVLYGSETEDMDLPPESIKSTINDDESIINTDRCFCANVLPESRVRLIENSIDDFANNARAAISRAIQNCVGNPLTIHENCDTSQLPYNSVTSNSVKSNVSFVPCWRPTDSSTCSASDDESSFTLAKDEINFFHEYKTASSQATLVWENMCSAVETTAKHIFDKWVSFK